MAKKIIWTCDICGGTVPNNGLIHQIIFEACNVDDECLEEVREEACYQVCDTCINKVSAIFTDHLRSKADLSKKAKKAIENYKKKGSGLATC